MSQLVCACSEAFSIFDLQAARERASIDESPECATALGQVAAASRADSALLKSQWHDVLPIAIHFYRWGKSSAKAYPPDWRITQGAVHVLCHGRQHIGCGAEVQQSTKQDAQSDRCNTQAGGYGIESHARCRRIRREPSRKNRSPSLDSLLCDFKGAHSVAPCGLRLEAFQGLQKRS